VHAELDKLIAALQAFYARETYLLEKDFGERALTHRLAVYIETQFPGWDVDCEYNRLGARTLRLPRGVIVSTDDSLGKSIYPDIVVHQRAVPQNLLAVEVRKAANYQPIEHDRHKLKALTDPHLWFAYWIGVLVTLAGKHVVAPEVYVGGAIDRPTTAWFAERLKQAGLADGL
jgi:hypothetical protein